MTGKRRISVALAARVKRRWREEGAVCYLCGRPIDFKAPPTSDMALEVEHYYPSSVRPDLVNSVSNLYPAHRVCNRLKGDKSPEQAILYKRRADWS